MGKISRWTPSRDTSGELPPPWPAILSISSKKMIPLCSTRSTASLITSSISMSFSASSSENTLRASDTFIRWVFFLGGITELSISWIFDDISSIPSGPITWSMGIDCDFAFILIMRLSKSPASNRIFNFSRVRSCRFITSSDIVSFSLLGKSISKIRTLTLRNALPMTFSSRWFLTCFTDTSVKSRIMDSTSRPT